MEMTKQRKMLIGVLCLGLGGLAVDRFVIGTPETAAAEDEIVTIQAPPDFEPLADPASVLGETDDSDGPAKALPSYATLTQRLMNAQANAGEQTPAERDGDPFALPQQWQAVKREILDQEDIEQPKKQHAITSMIKLDGTVRTEIDEKDELLAVITGGGLDGRAFRLNQILRVPDGKGKFDHYKLVEIGTRYVIWQDLNGEDRITMQVEKDL